MYETNIICTSAAKGGDSENNLMDDYGCVKFEYDSGGTMRHEPNGEPKYDVPLWQKMTLTIEEANALSGIGICKLRELTEEEDCPFVIWNGGKRRIKRKALEKYIDESFSI